MAKKFLITLLLISFLLLGGCLDSTQVGDTIVVLAHGWDTDGKTKLFSAQMALTPPREGEMETGPKFMVVSERAPSFAEAARNLSLSLLFFPVVYGFLLREELAIEHNLFAVLCRNPRVQYNVLLFVAGTTHQKYSR